MKISPCHVTLAGNFRTIGGKNDVTRFQREKQVFHLHAQTQSLIVVLNLVKQRILTLLLHKKHDTQVKPWDPDLDRTRIET